MSISPRKGRTNGFEEARKAYQPQINKDIRANRAMGKPPQIPILIIAR
jgi:hypothetical protein